MILSCTPHIGRATIFCWKHHSHTTNKDDFRSVSIFSEFAYPWPFATFRVCFEFFYSSTLLQQCQLVKHRTRQSVLKLPKNAWEPALFMQEMRKWFLCIALRISTAHDFQHTWALVHTKCKRFSKVKLDSKINARFLLNEHGDLWFSDIC